MMEDQQVADANKGAFLRDVVVALEQAGNRLCVLRGYARYPEYVGDDIDAICADPAAIPRVLLEQKVATVIQVLEHETTFYYLYRLEGGKPVFLTLDVAKNYGYRGRVFLEGEEFLNNCRDFKFFKVPAPELEFVSYLIRKVTVTSRKPKPRLSSRRREKGTGDPSGMTSEGCAGRCSTRPTAANDSGRYDTGRASSGSAQTGYCDPPV